MKKRLPTIDEWRKSEGKIVDRHIPRMSIDPEWKEKFLDKRKQPIIHLECGSVVDSKSKEAFCPGCGAYIVISMESRGRMRRPRIWYHTKSIGRYCPHCLKMTSFAFLQYTGVEGKKWSAWRCQCGTIYIKPTDESIKGDITLVGPSWKPEDLTPWKEGRKK